MGIYQHFLLNLFNPPLETNFTYLVTCKTTPSIVSPVITVSFRAMSSPKTKFNGLIFLAMHLGFHSFFCFERVSSKLGYWKQGLIFHGHTNSSHNTSQYLRLTKFLITLGAKVLDVSPYMSDGTNYSSFNSPLPSLNGILVITSLKASPYGMHIFS